MSTGPPIRLALTRMKSGSNLLDMRRQLAAIALSGPLMLSACSGSGASRSTEWKQSKTPDCSGGLCAEFDRTDRVASIIIVTGTGALPSGGGFASCGNVRSVEATCRKIADAEEVLWRGAGDVFYEASAKGVTRVELMRFLADLDLKSAGLQR